MHLVSCYRSLPFVRMLRVLLMLRAAAALGLGHAIPQRISAKSARRTPTSANWEHNVAALAHKPGE
jgi:hypothetical protein